VSEGVREVEIEKEEELHNFEGGDDFENIGE
jgi:hypothetical protein